MLRKHIHGVRTAPFIDDFVVPAICVFLAARLLTRIKIRRVPVKGR